MTELIQKNTENKKSSKVSVLITTIRVSQRTRDLVERFRRKDETKEMAILRAIALADVVIRKRREANAV